MVTMTDLQTRRAGLSASAELLVFVFFGSPTSRTGGWIVTALRLLDVVCAKDVPFGG